MIGRFVDRRDAGRQLAEALAHYGGRRDLVVLGLPRGGVVVAAEVALALDAPLDAFLVRKLGVPREPELAMGAIASGGVRVVNDDVVAALGIEPDTIEQVAEREGAELARREAAYRGDRPPPDLRGRTVIVVDDGLATGATMRAAVRAVRACGAAAVVVAVPTAPRETEQELRAEVDELVCLTTPWPFFGVGASYMDFGQTGDDEVRRLLGEAAAGGQEDEPGRDVTVRAGGATLPGRLTVPAAARGVVVFAHGSGSSLRSPRNRPVARRLHEGAIATLLFDMLTAPELEDDRLTGHHRFDVPLLAGRLGVATDQVSQWSGTAGLPLGYFGASVGAAAALVTAAERPALVRAVVCRGGRVDLAGPALSRVAAPTLLVVGSEDAAVLGVNRRAAHGLRCPHELRVVQGAGHLFEEPGALEQVAGMAAEWFERHLKG